MPQFARGRAPTSCPKFWEKPKPGWIKVNVDAAFFRVTGRAAVGIVTRDEQGAVTLSSGLVLFDCADAEEAELLACREGMNLAVQWVPKPIILETDCMTVCAALRSSGDNRSHLALLLKEVKMLAAELREVEINHFYRDQNRVAHFIANKACTESITAVWLGRTPDFAADVLAADCNPTLI